MNQAPSVTKPDGEIPMYHAVRNLSDEQIDQTVRKNAAARNFVLSDEHLAVIHTLVDHYRNDCQADDCLAAHEQMRFLEDAYQSEGGSKYLYQLFDTPDPQQQGVLTQIHELAGLPGLRLEADKGFGTAF